MQSSDSIAYATATELQEQTVLLKRAESAGLVLPEIKQPSYSLVKLTDDE